MFGDVGPVFTVLLPGGESGSPYRQAGWTLVIYDTGFE